MVKSLKVRGPFTGASGYDHHVREFVRELSRQRVQVQLEEMTDWGSGGLPPELRDPWFETLGAPQDARTTLHFCVPNLLAPDKSRFNVNFTMYETTRIPPSWVESHLAHDLIILPADYMRRVWIDSGVPEAKLRLCPLGVRSETYKPGIQPLELRDSKDRPVEPHAVRFLNVSTLAPRKNLAGLVRAWIRATTPLDDAALIMKLSWHDPKSLKRFRSQVKAIQKELGKSLKEAAPLHFIYDVYSEAEMPHLFASATHYMSVSFGEGWDLPMIEAAASGLKLIAPKHSGYLSYLNEDIAALIPSREAPAVHHDGSPEGSQSKNWFRDGSWWVPDEDEAVKLIREAVEGRDERRASAREHVSESFSWEKSTQRLIEILDEL